MKKILLVLSLMCITAFIADDTITPADGIGITFAMSLVAIKGKTSLKDVFNSAKAAQEERGDYSVISEDGIVKLKDVELKKDKNGIPFINLLFENPDGHVLKSPQYVGGKDTDLSKLERQLDFHFRILWGFGGSIVGELEVDEEKAVKDQLEGIAEALLNSYKGAIGHDGMIKIEDEEREVDGKTKKFKRLAYVTAVDTEA